MTAAASKIQLSLACLPGMHHAKALAEALGLAACGQLHEAGLGSIRLEHIQIVPQGLGQLDDAAVEQLRHLAPSARFRLHANARVLPTLRLADLSNLFAHADWLAAAARTSQQLNAPAYTAHAGRRANASLDTMLDNARRAADIFGCPVGVEGLYPTPGREWLVDDWAEYRQLFESGVPYALDLSHLNILVAHSRQRNDTLVAEMLACERCIEVHLSTNDGRADSHHTCTKAAWWTPLLAHTHPQALLFTEGNHLRNRRT